MINNRASTSILNQLILLSKAPSFSGRVRDPFLRDNSSSVSRHFPSDSPIGNIRASRVVIKNTVNVITISWNWNNLMQCILSIRGP